MRRNRRKKVFVYVVLTVLVFLNFGPLLQEEIGNNRTITDGPLSENYLLPTPLSDETIVLPNNPNPNYHFPLNQTDMNKLKTMTKATPGSTNHTQITNRPVSAPDSESDKSAPIIEHNALEEVNVNFSKVPMFLITEIVPDSTNIAGIDGYEFVEVYNNTNKDINIKDYKLLYRYGAEATTDVIWPSTPDDVVIKSMDTLVFWIIKDTNKNKTVADFNKNYNTNLIENQNILRISNAGIANIGMHGLVMADNTKNEISVAYYNDQQGVVDTKLNKGILFTYPKNGTTILPKISADEKKGTPGYIEPNQVPTQPVQVKEDREMPTLENLTTQTVVKETEDIHLSLDAEDDQTVKTVKVFYKVNDASDFKSVILQKDYNTLLFHHTVYSPEMIAKEYVEYYFVVSDGWNETKSDIYKVKITSDRNMENLRLNIKENQIISGKPIITGTSREESADKLKLLIDEREVATNTYHTLEHPAYLAFEVANVNTFFQNGVTLGGELLRIFDDWILEWQTITVPIQPNRLKIGDNRFTIHSGNKASPFDLDSVENRDDYHLRNVRLVLGDGTLLTDSSNSSPNTIIAMSDKHPLIDFQFQISKADAASKAYKWNTADVTDGVHTITVKDSNEEVTVPIIVDNTAPEIDHLINKNKPYKGEFVIDPVVIDAIAGVASIEITVDGKQITTPYKTSSSQLAPGKHVLRIKAIDKAGNTKTEKVSFSVVDELPYKPNLETGIGTIVGDPTLRVKVADPTNDEMVVTFYQAFQYKPSDTSRITAFQNQAEIEPPQTPVPEGEVPLTKAELDQISSVDGTYLTIDSTDKFPYHRFDVALDSSVDEQDVVELIWSGKSLAGRKVTMYAWSYRENKWKTVKYKIAKNKDFTLKSNINVAEYMKDHKINVLIQDEIPASANDYDYTFVWMSDTQYYSKLYPHIYDSQTQWIAQNKEALKIKYVFHTGDLVDESLKEYQWNQATQFMKTLENANIPYGVLAGNHDVDHKTSDYTQYYKYFGADRFSQRSFYGGTYKNNRGHYDVISAKGNDYLMVYLGWGVDEEGIAWVNDVLAEHPDKKAILCFHEYLLASGTRHPHGEALYNKIVLKNPNVIAVLSGHYHESQTLIDEIDDNGDGLPDRKVYQMLADFQAGPEGGQGYLRLLHIDQDNNRIIVNTYSPYLNDYNFYNSDVFPGKDEFVMDLNLQPEKKRVATDAFKVNVYTDSEIGKAKKVKSGESSEVIWSMLPENNSYSWYTVATDNFTGRTRSDIWSFFKGKIDGTGPKPAADIDTRTDTGGT